VQAVSAWTPPTGTLGALVSAAHVRAAALVSRQAELERRVEAQGAGPRPPSFMDALRQAHVAVIAEVKRRSPSKGAIAPALSAAVQATRYAHGGAAALSILTEPERFGGDIADLDDARGVVGIPLLKKDFNVDPRQVLEAAAHGASAVLLIARAMPPARLASLAAHARALGIEPFIEVRDESELDAALAAGGRVIGVNNRNLETLEIDATTGDRMLPRIPAACVAVWESGVQTVDDVRRAAAAGADAVLVGSSVSVAADAAAAVRALTGVTRAAGGRGA
jgi:indole-3-glycerol phosphate synthase